MPANARLSPAQFGRTALKRQNRTLLSEQITQHNYNNATIPLGLTHSVEVGNYIVSEEIVKNSVPIISMTSLFQGQVSPKTLTQGGVRVAPEIKKVGESKNDLRKNPGIIVFLKDVRFDESGTEVHQIGQFDDGIRETTHVNVRHENPIPANPTTGKVRKGMCLYNASLKITSRLLLEDIKDCHMSTVLAPNFHGTRPFSHIAEILPIAPSVTLRLKLERADQEFIPLLCNSGVQIFGSIVRWSAKCER
ncbi:hypothetical protein J6590_000443 [Homalodisca vitripennis]|nr:hypothetical protein J6590_000443 [Homalodisca vitripennis]